MMIDKTKKCLIGMVHLAALPGSPLHKMNTAQIADLALEEALLYQRLGLDAIMLENMHDIPYLNRKCPEESLAAISIIAARVRSEIRLPLGLQILAGCNRAALAVAHCASLDFIRAEGFVFGHMADEGYMDSDAGELLRYRKNLRADEIRIFTDIKKKHSAHALTEDINLAETAAAAEFFLSDGLIITGSSTGVACAVEDLRAVSGKTGLPVLIGSGITAENLADFWGLADAFIIGSYFKEDGKWNNPVSAERVMLLMEMAARLRATRY